MMRALRFLGMFAGGWIGWEIGALLSTFVAFFLAVIGTGVGLYFINRFAAAHLP